jgi:hypothetical protein
MIKNDDLALPWFTSWVWLLAAFFVATAVFHVWLVWLKPLSSIRWKQTDYVWLPCALLGCLWTVSSERISIALTRQDLARARVEGGVAFVRARIDLGLTANCQGYWLAPGSPTPEAIATEQRELGKYCAWFKRLSEGLSQGLSPSVWAKSEAIHIESIAGCRPSGDEKSWFRPLEESLFRELEVSVLGYNEAVRRLDDLRSAGEVQTGELLLLRVFGPTLVVLALALRLARVSAEIKTERKVKQVELGAGEDVS